MNTLILSGGSSKGPIYVGIFRYLFESNILKPSLENIDHIICCSIGIIFSLYLLFEINIDVQQELIKKINFISLLNMDDVSIESLLLECGLLDNNIVTCFIKSILEKKFNKSDITLQELYDYKSILLTVKCVNVTKKRNEYINYKNNPNLSILTLIKMTTCIPILFKPISYNNNLYVDGGLTGGYPIELVKNNYLGFNIIGQDNNNEFIKSIPLLDFIIKMVNIKVMDSKQQQKQYTIEYKTNIHFSEFNISLKQKEELIKLGYDITKKYIESNKEHLSDIIPIESILNYPQD